MQYSYVYVNGAYSIRSERGDYACYQTASGPRLRSWNTTAGAELWITGPHFNRCTDLVWAFGGTVVQAKPGRPSMQHRTHVPANGYKPAHGGYHDATTKALDRRWSGVSDVSGTVTGRMSSSSPAFQEVPRKAARPVEPVFIDFDYIVAKAVAEKEAAKLRADDGSNEEASTIPEALTGKLPEFMTLGEFLRYLLNAKG